MAGRHGQYPPELRERAVRLVAECRPDHASVKPAAHERHRRATCADSKK